MKYRKRIYYTAEQRAVMWDHYQRGDSLHTIARLFDRYHSSISRIISETGGIRPASRTRSKQTLSLSEREEISRGIVAGLSLRTMAQNLSRATSTISREINRNGGIEHYRANKADQRPGIEPSVLSPASYLQNPFLARLWLKNCKQIGLPNK